MNNSQALISAANALVGSFYSRKLESERQAIFSPEGRLRQPAGAESATFPLCMRDCRRLVSRWERGRLSIRLQHLAVPAIISFVDPYRWGSKMILESVGLISQGRRRISGTTNACVTNRTGRHKLDLISRINCPSAHRPLFLKLDHPQYSTYLFMSLLRRVLGATPRFLRVA